MMGATKMLTNKKLEDIISVLQEGEFFNMILVKKIILM